MLDFWRCTRKLRIVSELDIIGLIISKAEKPEEANVLEVVFTVTIKTIRFRNRRGPLMAILARATYGKGS